MSKNVAVSFVHGYSDLENKIEQDVLPALWTIEGGEASTHSYPFPRNVSDFSSLDGMLVGEAPLSGARDFEKLPRFGLTGLEQDGEFFYAGSWNAVYEICKRDKKLCRIITNSLMNDMHGIWVGDGVIITLLTGKDTIVISDMEGSVIDHFAIANDLSVYKNEKIEGLDWRFISKQFRGATGIWHFNYVQKFDDEVWLTSRNLGAFVVVNLVTKKAVIRTINQKTPVLLHDGVLFDDEYYFTSIDGKILIAAEAHKRKHNPREEFDDLHLFSRDMVCQLIRLDETDLGREPNWCRGIACDQDVIYVTIDGRYDSDLSFGLLALKRDGSVVRQDRLNWRDIGPERELRFVTGFDITLY